MKKLGWYLVSAAVATLILGGAMLLVANLYVQSRAVQLRIRQALASNLRMPVSLKKTTFTPWDGLRIDGFAARTNDKLTEKGATLVNELVARSFRVHFALRPLFQRRFEIEDVLLDQPRLSWAQDRDDRWHLPSEKPANPSKHEREKIPPVDHVAVGPGSLPVAADPIVTSTPESVVDADAMVSLSAEHEKPSVAAKRLIVDKLRLRHGSMEFFNHSHGLLGRFEEVNVNGRLTGFDHANGTASFEHAVLPRAGVKLAHVRSGFAYDRQDGLVLRDVAADFAGGAIHADCHVRTAKPGTPYDLRCRLEGVSIDQLLKDAGGSRGLFQGRLQGNLDASGFSDDAERNSAAGEVSLEGAQIRDFPLLQTIGTMLQINDLQHLQFKTARLAYRVEGTTVQIQPLVLASNDLQVTAQGQYFSRADRLDLHARLVIDQAISRQLPRLVEQQFTPGGSDAPGARYVDFDINGPINKPNSNLYQKVLPNALDSLLDNFMRRGPKHSKEKSSRSDKPTPAPSVGGTDL